MKQDKNITRKAIDRSYAVWWKLRRREKFKNIKYRRMLAVAYIGGGAPVREAPPFWEEK